MNIWIINPYGNLPNENWRPHRSYTASEAFAAEGHSVTYWISNIDHRSKNYRTAGESNNVDKVINVRIIDSTSYIAHISLKRIKFEVNFIKNFCRVAENELDKPDLIIIGEPSLFVSYHFVKFAKQFEIPFIIDMVDIWPELFRVALPNLLKPFDTILFYPLYKKRAWFIKKAAGILSVSKAYLELAKKLNKTGQYKIVYWGVDLKSFDNLIINDLGFEKEIDEFWVIYAGTLGDNYDTQGIIECAKLMENSSVNYKLFIAGDGNLKQFVVDSIATNNLKKSHYLGRVNPSDLVGFYKLCDVALSTYTKDSTVSMPIKAFDYFAAGLPVLNSLGMDLGHMIEKHKLGVNYKAGDHVELFRKLEYLVNNRDFLNEMKENCLEMAKQFDEKIIYKEYVTFCEDVLKKTKRV